MERENHQRMERREAPEAIVRAAAAWTPVTKGPSSANPGTP